MNRSAVARFLRQTHCSWTAVWFHTPRSKQIMALSLPFSTLEDKAEEQAGASAGSTQTRITLHFDTDSHESRKHSACCTGVCTC